MMKKYAGKVLAAAMAVSMMACSGVMAAETATATSETETTCETTVKYSVTAGYTWQVPATIAFEKDAGVGQTRTANGEVKVTNNIIAEGRTLKIKIASDEDFTITSGTNTKLNYTVKKQDATEALIKDGEILSVAAGTKEGAQNLVYTLSTTTDAAEVAGEYTGTLNYVASVE